MRTNRTIVAMGGGGFSEEAENPLLDDYILSLTEKARPRVCFLATASGDAEGYVERFRAAFPEGRAEASALALFRRTIVDLEAFLLGQDVVYVGGGNTANMLAVWRVHGVDRILRAAWERGVVLCGLSAGALCWFEDGLTDSFSPNHLAPLHDGLGLLPGSFCPHYDGDPLRRPAFEGSVRSGALPPGFAADDGVGLHFEGTELHAVVSSRPKAMAWRLDAPNGRAVQPLAPRYLGATAPVPAGRWWEDAPKRPLAAHDDDESGWVLQTERLALRWWRLDDAEAQLRIFGDPRVHEHTGAAPWESLAAARAWLEREAVEAKARGFGHWAVVERATGDVVGSCGFRSGFEQGELEIGFTIEPSRQGRGYATEAAAACLRHGAETLGASKILSLTKPANAPARRVLEKLGMRMRGIEEHDAVAWCVFDRAAFPQATAPVHL